MEKLLVLTLIAAALIGKSLAIDRIVVNADNRINKLYIDGIDRTNDLVNRKDWKHCDKIDIPLNSGVIAIEAVNLKSFYSIQACETARNVIYDPWRCRRVLKAQTGWYMPNYRARYWKLAKGFRCKKHCRKYYKQPCKLYNQKCYWTNKYARRVRCRVKLCADNCKKCDTAGPGKCDEGQCFYGPTTSEGTCPRECGVEIKMYSALPNDGPCGYFKVWDTASKTPQIIDLSKKPGLYGVAVDMSTCSIFEEPLYRKFPESGTDYQALIDWEALPTASGVWSATGKFTNKVGFKFIVGRGPGVYTTATVLDRFISLGIADMFNENNYVRKHPCLYRATFRAAADSPAILVPTEELIGDIQGEEPLIRTSQPCCP
jgi:hypothetical protein